MTVTDAALAHEAVDATRTAMMGGSYGGYMANWIAGHTDRFAAIVSHASLWNLDTFGGTTDAPWYWRRETRPPRRRPSTPPTGSRPDHHADAGDPRRQGLPGADRRGTALWWALNSTAPRPDGRRRPAPVAHKFLYFPDENHWVLSPHHAEVWYETVLAFLDHHVLGREWVRPDRLG